MFVFFKYFIINNWNADLMNGLARLKRSVINVRRYKRYFLRQNNFFLFYLEAKSSLGVFEVGLGRGGAVEGLVVHKAGAAKLGARSNHGEHSVSTAFHNLENFFQVESSINPSCFNHLSLFLIFFGQLK